MLNLIVKTTDPDLLANHTRVYPIGESLKYRTESGNIYTLSTGVTPEEVEDIVANLITAGSGIDINYDDVANTLTISIDAATLSTINSALQVGDSVSSLLNDVQYQTLSQVNTLVNNHANLVNNPHSVTAAQVGLSNVDNTSDLDKPVSTATQAAINAAIAGQLLGDNFQDFSDLNTFSTTSDTFVQAYVFNTSTKDTGRYRVGFTYTYEPSSTGSDDEFEVRIDGDPINLIALQEGKDTGSDQGVLKSSFGYVTFFTQTTHIIEVYVRQTGGGTTVVKGTIIEIWRAAA